VDGAIAARTEGVCGHHAAGDMIMRLWTEFGRRVRDNGSGADHGAGGMAMVIGERVKGGMSAEYPSLT
jgi:uncharacterized protein (DUF1501 family)